MENNNLLNLATSYKEKCGWYYAEAAELVVAKEGSKKGDSVRFSLKKFGRSGAVGFSHYFNIGIPDDVKRYKDLGVTETGISDEDLEKANARWENAFDKRGRKIDNGAMPFEFYGFWHQINFGTTMKNKNSGKTADSTMVFIPCDEDTGLSYTDFCVTADRLANIMANYEPVNATDDADSGHEESPEEELARLRAEAAARK